MRRRILVAMVAVTVVATVVLTVPLTVINAHREADLSVQELERAAQRTLAELPSNIGTTSQHIDLPKLGSLEIAIYRPDGSLLTGRGPAAADPVTARARRFETNGVHGASR